MGRGAYDLSVDQYRVVEEHQKKAKEEKAKAEEEAKVAKVEHLQKNRKKIPDELKDVKPVRVYGDPPKRDLKPLAPKPVTEEGK